MYKDPNELLVILNNTLKKRNIEMTMGFIVGMIKSADIFLTEEEIKNYLEKKKDEKFIVKDYSNMNYGERLLYILDLRKYEYVPYTYKYYKKTINILKKKCLMFVRLIESITNKDVPNEELIKYDISIDKNGNILSTDIKRIVEPFVYNLYLLITKLNEANELDTYLKNKIDLDYIYRNGADEDDYYPTSELQPDIKTLVNNRITDQVFIPFTTKQEVIRDQQRMKEFSETMNSLEELMPLEFGKGVNR